MPLTESFQVSWQRLNTTQATGVPGLTRLFTQSWTTWGRKGEGMSASRFWMLQTLISMVMGHSKVNMDASERWSRQRSQSRQGRLRDLDSIFNTWTLWVSSYPQFLALSMWLRHPMSQIFSSIKISHRGSTSTKCSLKLRTGAPTPLWSTICNPALVFGAGKQRQRTVIPNLGLKRSWTAPRSYIDSSMKVVILTHLQLRCSHWNRNPRCMSAQSF